jgi:hypothetical protein
MLIIEPYDVYNVKLDGCQALRSFHKPFFDTTPVDSHTYQLLFSVP